MGRESQAHFYHLPLKNSGRRHCKNFSVASGSSFSEACT